MMKLSVTYSQTIEVEVNENDSVDAMLDKIKDAVSEQHYPLPYDRKYLEFVIDECFPDKPELVGEMLD